MLLVEVPLIFAMAPPTRLQRYRPNAPLVALAVVAVMVWAAAVLAASWWPRGRSATHR